MTTAAALVLSRLVHAIVAVSAAAAAIVAGGNIVHAITQESVTATHSMQVAGLTRTYETITPTATLPNSAPIIVVLAGISATVTSEIARDHLVPYANAGKAELVYPVGYKESWNAIGCCGKAAAAKVDDVAFMEALAAQVDPGHQHPLDVVGYSNGGRLAYRMACDYPGTFDATAIVKADPEEGCVVSKPTSIMQIAARDDTAVPYKPGVKGKETPPATVQVGRLRSTDECTGDGVTTKPGSAMQFTVWSDCTSGTRVGFAVYSVGGHNFPPPTAHQPAAAQAIWAFFNHDTTVSALPS